jgi:hypothetical protein
MHQAIHHSQLFRNAVQSETIWKVGITLLVLSVTLQIYSVSVADPDLWGHLRFGLDTLESGKIVSTDPYSYLTAGQPWIRQDWLAGVIFALLWRSVGAAGLISLKALIGILTVGMIFRQLSQEATPVRAAILIMPTLLLFKPAVLTVRPQLFSMLLLTMAALILRKAEKGRYRLLWLFPPMFAIWANLHGGFLMGIAVFGLWACVHWLYHRRAWLQIFLPLAASLAATVINPYGFDLPVLLARTLTISFPEMTEWQPLNIISILGAAYLVLLGLALFGLFFSQRERRLPLIVPFVFMSLLPLTAIRHVALFPIIVLMFISEHILDAWERVRPMSGTVSKLSSIFLLSPLAGALIMSAISLPNFREIPLDFGQFPYPVQTVVLIKESGVKGNLAIRMDWGFFAIWNLAPKIKVSADGRQHFAYSDETYLHNLQFMYGIGDWSALLDDYPTDMALVSKDFASYNLLLLRSDWTLVYEDSNSALFVRNNSPILEPIQKTAKTFTPLQISEGFPAE